MMVWSSRLGRDRASGILKGFQANYRFF